MLLQAALSQNPEIGYNMWISSTSTPMRNISRNDRAGYALREHRLLGMNEAFGAFEPVNEKQDDPLGKRIEALRKELQGTTGAERTKIVVAFLATSQSAEDLMVIGINALTPADLQPILDPARITADTMAIPSNALLVMRAMLQTAGARGLTPKEARGIAESIVPASIRVISHPITHENAPVAYYHAFNALHQAAQHYFAAGAADPATARTNIELIQKAVTDAGTRIDSLPDSNVLRPRLQKARVSFLATLEKQLKALR